VTLTAWNGKQTAQFWSKKMAEDLKQYNSYEEALAARGTFDKEPHQCEYCNLFFWYTPEKQSLEYDLKQRRTYCSLECAADADEDCRVNQIESKREFEMWGDDLDSWYR